MYRVVLPSFLAGGGERKNQKEMRGIFDGNILTHVPGDRFIYDVVKEYFQKNSPIEQYLEGRLNIVNQKPSSVSSVVMSPALLMLVTVMFKMWN